MASASGFVSASAGISSVWSQIPDLLSWYIRTIYGSLLLLSRASVDDSAASFCLKLRAWRYESVSPMVPQYSGQFSFI
eukprot:scaffold2166_cov159-Ochromonas_danica.AAC.1